MQQVSVPADLRRPGVATALLLHNLVRLKKARATAVRLHVNGDDVSSARSLHKRLGGSRIVDTHVRFRKPVAHGRAGA